MNNRIACGLALGAGLVLTGCGGGGSDAEVVATPTATQPAAVAAALAYIADQQKLPSTDIDPETLRQSLPTPDDTIEPAPV